MVFIWMVLLWSILQPRGANAKMRQARGGFPAGGNAKTKRAVLTGIDHFAPNKADLGVNEEQKIPLYANMKIAEDATLEKKVIEVHSGPIKFDPYEYDRRPAEIVWGKVNEVIPEDDFYYAEPHSLPSEKERSVDKNSFLEGITTTEFTKTDFVTHNLRKQICYDHQRPDVSFYACIIGCAFCVFIGVFLYYAICYTGGLVEAEN